MSVLVNVTSDISKQRLEIKDGAYIAYVNISDNSDIVDVGGMLINLGKQLIEDNLSGR